MDERIQLPPATLESKLRQARFRVTGQRPVLNADEGRCARDAKDTDGKDALHGQPERRKVGLLHDDIADLHRERGGLPVGREPQDGRGKDRVVK